MFDLDQHVRQWRKELEATLAFSSEEIDELEDHLRFSFDAKLKEGLAPENAWTGSLGGLGSASALALEFAKDKLMPALWRLLVSWWRPACLLILFGFIFFYSSFQPPTLANEKPPLSVARMPVYWEIVGLSFLVTLILLPNKAQKNAVLAGVGNAFCLIPLLHVIFYNTLTEKTIGVGWSGMAASFGWWPISLGFLGLIVINVWWWKPRPALAETKTALRAIAGILVFVLALSPFVSEWIGNLSIREVYSMPTPGELTYTGTTLSDFLKWKFVDVLVDSCIYIVNFLPFGLALVMCLGVCLIQCFARGIKVNRNDEIFPSAASLPWMLALLGASLGWTAGDYVEPNFSTQMRQATASVSHSNFTHGGLEITILFSAALFFICAWELTKKLAQATRLRPFYAWITVIFEVVFSLGILPLFSGDPKGPQSDEPGWLSWVLALTVLSMAFYQVLLIVRKLRHQSGEISLWKFDGKNLVEMGLLLGLIFSGSWLILGMVALVMAFESVFVISAMIAWGEWIQYPIHHHFYPQMSGTPDHLAFWVACGITYLSFCLAAGLCTVMIMSALEFIRFNGYRLYKMRKVRQGLVQSLALNE